MNLSSDLEALAMEAPDKIGLIFEDGTEFSFRQINTESNKIANFLRSKGVGKGERIGVYMQNSPVFVFTLFGIWKTGAVLVPVNIMYQTEELVHAFSSTEVSKVITDSSGVENILSIKDNLESIMVSGSRESRTDEAILDFDTEIQKYDGEFETFVPSDDDVAAILFTGGTTGAPKAVITNHSGWYKALCDLTAGHTGSGESRKAADESVPPNIVAMPLFHGGGQQTLLFAYHIGRSVLLMEKFRVEKFINLTQKYRVRSLVLMPTMIHDIVNYEGNLDFSHVRTVTSIGQELRPHLKARFEERFNIPILTNYGSTEVGHVAGWGVKDLKEGRWKPGSVGRLYPGVELEIRDNAGNALPPGEVGEIFVNSQVTTKGYAGNAEENKELIHEGWIRTGDMGYLDNDGVLFIKGRKRDMIKCGGFQVWPMEIEKVLMKHPKVKDVAVVGVEDDRMGEIPKAFIILNDNAVQEDAEALKQEMMNYCRDNLAHFKAVRAVEFVTEFPRADTGKILKDQLKGNS